MGFRVQFLGTGTSVGVPQIGCTCRTCRSDDPRDTRRRSGLYVRAGETAFVIDTPPEFRLACLELGIVQVDAVVLTHVHMDHVAGFDDIRRFNTLNGQRPLPCFAAAETIAALRAIFPYITDRPNAQGLYRPMIDFTPVDAPFRIGDAVLTPVPVAHGGVRTNGYVISYGGARVAYVPDCCALPPASLDSLRGVDLMILDCLRERPHPTHFNLDGARAALRAIRPARALITHMCHDLTHADWLARLPDGVAPAYDGLTVDLIPAAQTD